MTQFAIVYLSFIFQFLLGLIELLLVVIYFLVLCLLLFLLLFEPVLDGNCGRQYLVHLDVLDRFALQWKRLIYFSFFFFTC